MLNRSKPHDIVYGVPGVGFMQDGKPFKPNGEPCTTVQRVIRSDDGKNIETIDVAADIAHTIEEASEPVEEVVEEVEEKTEDPFKIPDFVSKVPLKPKYPSQMNVTECTTELKDNGIEIPEDAKLVDLRKLVSDNR